MAPMPIRVHLLDGRIAVLAVAMMLTGCALHRRPPTPAEEARDQDMSARSLRGGPRQFVPDLASGTDSTMVAGGTTCVRVMTDPRDGARVQLERVLPEGRGDYVVAAGHYGVKPGELLRLHCVDGTAAGFVPK